MQIAGDGVMLAGTLHLPRVKSKVPAVVIVHGSGPTTREMTTFWTNSVLRAGGTAVLVYDKRGTGHSTGVYPEWNVASTPKMFSDLATSRERLIRFLFIGEGVPLPAAIEDIHSTYLDAVARFGETRPTLRQMNAADALVEDYIGERGYDPAAVLSSLDIPMLWTFGLYDEAIPTRLSIDRLGELRR